MAWDFEFGYSILTLHKKESGKSLEVKIFDIGDVENIRIRETTWGRLGTSQNEVRLTFEDLEYIYEKAKAFLKKN
ncbi:hypothetical protein MFS40622_1114 [Methanocaldococcus sp. FS406-22]|uniref:hypothetical protein n=1 Tax=Methanocaldococcus sp. (strain FS406-22) TaxID=644281 RepID=UPI0001BF350E|nr:hypothetical protein [Methanocaldococcus sp. FS406-22]ADC69794.1 hypothetical protein MFS40622_1114 [Methanocaldococcus sp. FS406-22]